MEYSDYLRFVAAFGFIIGLILVCAWGARRMGLTPQIGATENNKRLAVIETLNLDAKRKLILIRRDGKEHLLLLGETDMTIEGGFDAVQPVVQPITPKDQQNTGDTDERKTTTREMGGPVLAQMNRVVSLIRERTAS